MPGSPEENIMGNKNSGLNLNINKETNRNGNTKTTNTDQAHRPGLDQAVDSTIGLFAREIICERNKAGLDQLEPHLLAAKIRQRIKEGILATSPRSKRKYGGLI
jgi:hypothetical protein